MTDPYSLSRLCATLRDAPPDAPLRFAAADAATRGGWHVTRMSLAALGHVDCDGARSGGAEAVVEILDVAAGAPMPVGRFLLIADRSAAALPGLDEAPLRVALEGARHAVAGVEADGAVTVRLRRERASCRPAAASAACC